MQKLPLWVKLIPFYAVFVVLILTALFIQQNKERAVFAASQHANQVIETQKTEGPTEAPITGIPARIIIARAGIDLSVVNGTYNNGEWVVRDGVANFATITHPLSNQSGTTLIYGHNNPYTFGHLSELQVGDEVIIYTQEGHIFKYRYVTAQDVKPTDVSIFENLEGAPTLKLLTCSGSWLQNRRIFTLQLVEAVR